ncbi:MAG: Transketolase, pyridine binding domain protein [Roseomonas sp.]|nr:Transketolase, pyridine binding domain protein [Roseomonas sp.]
MGARPAAKLHGFLVPAVMDGAEWGAIAGAAAMVEAARQAAERRPVAEPGTVLRHVFSGDEPQAMGGLRGVHAVTLGLQENSARSASLTPACWKKASSAGPWAWRLPG